MEKENKRKVVIPGEIIMSGKDFLPGENTEKRGEDIVALRYGLAEEQNRLIKVIPLSGVYIPRRGNVIIGVVENVTIYGWVVSIGVIGNAFLPVAEYPRYIERGDLEDFIQIGDIIVAKIIEVNRRGIDLTLKAKGLGKVDDGMIVQINSNRVPRVIGKEGSMVNLIKTETNCNITVGQNGLIWIKGQSIEEELFAKKAVLYVAERATVDGLTDKVKEWFEKGERKMSETAVTTYGLRIEYGAQGTNVAIFNGVNTKDNSKEAAMLRGAASLLKDRLPGIKSIEIIVTKE